MGSEEADQLSGVRCSAPYTGPEILLSPCLCSRMGRGHDAPVSWSCAMTSHEKTSREQEEQEFKDTAGKYWEEHGHGQRWDGGDFCDLFEFMAKHHVERLSELQRENERLQNDHHKLGSWPDCKHCLRFFAQDEDHAATNARLNDELEVVTAQLSRLRALAERMSDTRLLGFLSTLPGSGVSTDIFIAAEEYRSGAWMKEEGARG